MASTKSTAKTRAIKAEYQKLYMENAQSGVYNESVVCKLRELKARFQVETEYNKLGLR